MTVERISRKLMARSPGSSILPLAVLTIGLGLSAWLYVSFSAGASPPPRAAESLEKGRHGCRGFELQNTVQITNVDAEL